jgi:hypothetical protein
MDDQQIVQSAESVSRQVVVALSAEPISWQAFYAAFGAQGLHPLTAVRVPHLWARGASLICDRDETGRLSRLPRARERHRTRIWAAAVSADTVAVQQAIAAALLLPDDQASLVLAWYAHASPARCACVVATRRSRTSTPSSARSPARSPRPGSPPCSWSPRWLPAAPTEPGGRCTVSPPDQAATPSSLVWTRSCTRLSSPRSPSPATSPAVARTLGRPRRTARQTLPSGPTRAASPGSCHR